MGGRGGESAAVSKEHQSIAIGAAGSPGACPPANNQRVGIKQVGVGWPPAFMRGHQARPRGVLSCARLHTAAHNEMVAKTFPPRGQGAPAPAAQPATAARAGGGLVKSSYAHAFSVLPWRGNKERGDP